MTRCSFGAKHTVAPLYAIEIDFKNTLLAQQLFHEQGDNHFLGFAHQRTFAGQKQIFCQLLADGRTADDFDRAGFTAIFGFRRPLCSAFFGLAVFRPGFFQCGPVDAVVAGKTVVLGGDHRTLERLAQLRIRLPALTPAHSALLLQLAPDLRALKTGGLRIHPDHGCNAQRKIQLQTQQRQAQHPEQSQQGH